MKDFSRGFTVLFFYTSLLIQPKPAGALVGFGQVYTAVKGHQHRTRPFENEQIAFLAHFIAYSKFTLYLHGIEIKKKIACLGYPELAEFYLLEEFEEGDEVHQATKEALDGYIESDDCKTLIDETLPDIMRTFLEMRVRAGLNQALDHEITLKLMNRSGNHINGHVLHPEFLYCDRLEEPIYVRETKFCLEELSSIVDITPDHLIQKSNLLFIDDLVSNRDLPDIADLHPLTWPEVVHASMLFQDKYVNNEITDYSIAGRVDRPEGMRLYELREFYDQNEFELYLDAYGLEYGRYMAARNFQRPGGMFSEIPEESAPYEYTKEIAKYPFLAFMVPDIEERPLDCETDRLVAANPKLITLCERYKESFDRKSDLPNFHIKVTKRTVAEALKVSLDLNYEMINGIERDYPIKDLYTEEGELRDTADYYSLKSWNTLMKMKNLNEHFFNLFPQFEDQERRFVEILNRRESAFMWGSIALSVGVGFGCGFIGNIWGLMACLGVAGIGLNVGLFYMSAYRAYEEDFGMFFAIDVTQESEGELVSLIEFGTLESSLQNLYLEKLFLGVGTGLGEIFKKARHLRRLSQ